MRIEKEVIQLPRDITVSPAAAEYVRKHEDEAKRIVAEALEQAAANDPSDSTSEPRPRPRIQVPPHLRRFVVSEPQDPQLLNLSEAAARAAISRPTLNSRIDNNLMI